MTWQCRNVLVSTHFWLFIISKSNETRTKHSYKLTMYRTYSQKVRMFLLRRVCEQK